MNRPPQAKKNSSSESEADIVRIADIEESAVMVQSRKVVAGIRSEKDDTIALVFDLTAPTKGQTINGSMGIVVRGREWIGEDYAVDYTLYRLTAKQQAAKVKPVKAAREVEVPGEVRTIVAPTTDRIDRLETALGTLAEAIALIVPATKKPRSTK